MKRLVMIFLIGLVLFVGGFSLLTVYVRGHQAVTTVVPNVSAAAQITHSPNVIDGQPVRFQVPSLGMNLAVIPGYYDTKTGQWTLTRDKVQYAAITPEPNNESGNTFLYGHYRQQVFARLHLIKPGSEAIVTTSNNHVFYYKLRNVSVVNPNDSASIFNYSGKPILTVQTCTGLFFQNRQLFTFDLERVK
jgi:LPXTG-site transpeptidase (sortase) family protein